MFASRWNQNGGHWAWLSSVGIHAVSESIMGPYVDKGLTWPTNSGGKGHNLTILQLKDGTYASVVSDTRPEISLRLRRLMGRGVLLIQSV